MFDSSYLSRTIDWVQSQPRRLGLPSLIQDTATSLNSSDDDGSESTHSGELIEWDESPFCEIKMKTYENHMLQHRVHELQKQLQGSYGVTTAASRASSKAFCDSGVSAFDELISSQGLLSHIATPIRAILVREVLQRRKVELELVSLRREKALAVDECRLAWKKMEEMMNLRSADVALHGGRVEDQCPS